MLTINLTTTQQRLELCRIALTSLMLQSRLPDQINLWVSQEPYLRDQGISDTSVVNRLTETLPKETQRLVRIRWTPNTGPYRKLIPMLREAGKNDVIVTADDDIFYGRDWLNGLLTAYEKAGGKIVAARVRTQQTNFLGKKKSYLYWKLINQPSVVDNDFVVTFGGGAVLTRAMFREKDIADESFLKVAATSDDLWYSKLLMLKSNKVAVVPSLLGELNFIHHSDGLTNDNFPPVASLLYKIRLRLWDRPAGFLGVPVCGNDVAYQQIERHFTELA